MREFYPDRLLFFPLVRRSAAILLAAATLALAGSALALPTAPEPERARCPSASTPRMSLRARWSRIRSTSSCWFFSGPGDLGRDDHLGTSATWTRAGDRVELRFGSLLFAGRAEGRRVILRRASTHAYGAGWRVDEIIEGTFTPPDAASCGLVARYHYDECDTGAPGSCPGQCHIDATVRFELR